MTKGIRTSTNLVRIGEPCKRGHTNGRYETAGCRECALLKWNERRLKNPVEFLLRSARQRAKRKGLDFSVEKQDILVPLFCPLLGIRILYENTNQPVDGSATLDRVDNSKGYVKGNVWVISYRANSIKRDASLEELMLLTANLLKNAQNN